jgi:hypothetical protein
VNIHLSLTDRMLLTVQKSEESAMCCAAVYCGAIFCTVQDYARNGLQNIDVSVDDRVLHNINTCCFTHKHAHISYTQI